MPFAWPLYFPPLLQTLCTVFCQAEKAKGLTVPGRYLKCSCVKKTPMLCSISFLRNFLGSILRIHRSWGPCLHDFCLSLPTETE